MKSLGLTDRFIAGNEGPMRWGALAVFRLAIVAGLAAGCDPMPMVRLKNETSREIVIRFQEDRRGDFHLEQMYAVAPRHSARFPAGYTVDNHIVVVSGICAYTFPLAGDEAINGAYGAVTDLAVAPDLKLHLRDRRASEQPKDWPLSPMAKACRQASH